MKTSRIAAGVLLAFLSTTVPRAAVAQDDPVTVQARARFKEGVDFYDKGQFENARLAFLQAYALKKHPAVLLNLAQSTAKAGHPLEAAKYFQQFLKESTTASPAQRTDAEKGLEEVRQKLGRIEIVAATGTEITLDEKERLGTAPFNEPIDVDPGSHSLRSSSETVRVTAVAGQKVQARFGGAGAAPPVVIPVVPPGTSPPNTPPPDPNATQGGALSQTPPDQGGPKKKTNLLAPPKNMTPFFVGIGVGGVGLAGAIIFAAFKADAQSKADSVASEIRQKAGPDAPGICSRTDTATVERFGPACQTLKDNNDKVDTNATIANVSIGVMITGFVFSGIYYLAANKKDDESEPAPAPAAAPPVNGILNPKFTPYAGYGNGGFMLTGEF